MNTEVKMSINNRRHTMLRHVYGAVISLGAVSLDCGAEAGPDMGEGILGRVDQMTEAFMGKDFCGVRKVFVGGEKGKNVIVTWEVIAFRDWESMNRYLKDFPGDQRWVYTDFGKEG